MSDTNEPLKTWRSWLESRQQFLPRGESPTELFVENVIGAATAAFSIVPIGLDSGCPIFWSLLADVKLQTEAANSNWRVVENGWSRTGAALKISGRTTTSAGECARLVILDCYAVVASLGLKDSLRTTDKKARELLAKIESKYDRLSLPTDRVGSASLISEVAIMVRDEQKSSQSKSLKELSAGDNTGVASPLSRKHPGLLDLYIRLKSEAAADHANVTYNTVIDKYLPKLGRQTKVERDELYNLLKNHAAKHWQPEE